jgi:peptidoglycan/xylan/chitin deacetylase (PgdA/CDA1 family)
MPDSTRPSTTRSDDSPDIHYRPLPPLKLALARTLHATGLSAVGRRMQRLFKGPHIRVINCHELLPSAAHNFDEQVRFYAQHYAPVGPQELDDFHAGRWNAKRPGLIITFDDGWQCQARYAPPILERHGFVGWFFIPVGFVEEPHARFVRQHMRGGDLNPMTWDDLRRLSRKHVIGGHTYSHLELPAGTSQAVLQHELVDSKRRLESELDREITSFAWVRGRECDYGPEASQVIARAGYRHVFLTTSGVLHRGDSLLKIPRTNIEARYPPWLVTYALNGIPDLLGRSRRRRIEHILDQRDVPIFPRSTQSPLA